MSVDSYLELFTTLFGWAFYGVLWDVPVGTGIVYLPFLGILIDNWREPAEGGEFGTVTGLSLRRMEIELFIALLVVVLAGQPAALTPLNAGTLSYSPIPTLGNPAPPDATISAPQSTHGSAGFTGSPASVNIPVWWYAVLAMTSGFNHAVVEGLPAASDLRTFEQQARLATIADPRLRQEVSDFFTECYVPARSKYQAERPDTAAVSATLATYGEDDPDWMGSHVYRSTAGYYESLRPSKQIPGWAYDPARDTEYDPADPPTWGKPTCKEWWEDGAQALRKQLTDEADATSAGFSGLVVAVAPSVAGEQQQDAVARTVLNNAPPVWSNNDLVANNTGTTGLVGTAENLIKGGLAAGGVLTASALFSVTMTAVLQALPMVQALMLLGVYALLPLVVVLSRYSLLMMAIGAMAIFTVKFWSVLWYLAMWVDQNLIQSMYPDVNVFLQIFANPGEHDTKRMLLNMITTSLYLGLPLLWSGMMAWAGVNVGRAMTQFKQILGRGTRIREDYKKLYFTVMDFKNATRLFQDPEFDGEPVTVYEPRPEEPVIPPEDLTITDNTSDASGLDTEAESSDLTDNDFAATRIREPTAQSRYTIEDVRVRTAIERFQYLDANGRLVTEDYRVLLRDEIRKTLRREFASLADFLRRWTDAERKQALLDELAEQGVPIEVLREAVPNGQALDAFDLVAHIAFDQPPLSRRERAENVRKRNYFGKYGDDARAVLDVLLDKYADHGIADIEDPKVLELPPFDRIGSKTRIRRGIFGGSDKFSEALTELERQLYQDSA